MKFLGFIAIFVGCSIVRSLQYCDDPRVCRSDDFLIEICLSPSENPDTLRLDAWSGANELFSLTTRGGLEHVKAFLGCPQITHGEQISLWFISEEFQLERVEIADDELDLAMLSYTSLQHRNKFEQSLEKTRLKRNELLHRIGRLMPVPLPKL